MIPILLLFGFAAASACAYHRWRTPGIGVLCVALLAIDAAWGTMQWMRPHTDYGRPRPWDWPCHATATLMPISILGLGVALALHFTRNRYADLQSRLLISGLVCGLLIAPVIVGMLWWSVGVLRCDTL